ncbi:hypothetical protein B0H19DRAFT_1084003 [Mycena capillaripes]|nr:hypothetical protein B0H19DRAFT_1084003 [Mycena capillaripes]
MNSDLPISMFADADPAPGKLMELRQIIWPDFPKVWGNGAELGKEIQKKSVEIVRGDQEALQRPSNSGVIEQRGGNIRKPYKPTNKRYDRSQVSASLERGTGLSGDYMFALGSPIRCSAGETPADPPLCLRLGPLRGAYRWLRRPTAWGFGLFFVLQRLSGSRCPNIGKAVHPTTVRLKPTAMGVSWDYGVIYQARASGASSDKVCGQVGPTPRELGELAMANRRPEVLPQLKGFRVGGETGAGEGGCDAV